MKTISHQKNPALIRKIVQTLSKRPYFSALDKELLSHVIASGATVQVKKNEVLIEQGAGEISTFYILLKGELTVYRDEAFITTLHRPGQVIGEMSILTGRVRTAKVVADKPSTLVALSARFLQKPTAQTLNFNYKYLMLLSRILVEKLVNTTEKAKLYEDALWEVSQAEEYSEQLKQEIQQKLEQIKLYSEVVARNLDAILICQASGDVLECNRAFSQLFGYEREELAKLNVFSLFDQLTEGKEKDFLTKRCQKGWKGERKAIGKGNRRFEAYMTISPIKSTKTKSIMAYAIEVRDISLQKEYEETVLKKNVELRTAQQMLEETVQELEKSTQIKNIFFSNISSQLKTPLISIGSFADLLLQQHQADEFYDYLKKICSEGKKLERMVDNILTMTETGKDITDLSLKVFRVEDLLAYLTEEANIKLISKKPSIDIERKTLLADPLRIRKALEECITYLRNNYKNSEKSVFYYEYVRGEDAHTFLLAPKEIRGGIPSRDEILEVTEQSAELDLPLAKRIIEVHKGELVLRVYQDMPVIRISLPTEPERGLIRPARILLVDESKRDRALYRESIEKSFEDAQIVEFEKPIDALSAIHSLTPDVIVVDPDFKQGPWVYKTFFQKVVKANTHQAKILIISEILNDANKRKELLDLEVHDYLAKPFSSDVFEFRLSRILEVHQQVSILHKSVKQALQSSFTDGLTTLFNRRYYDKFIKEQMIKSKIQGIQCSVILTDVDNFKHYNDTNGHQLGDVVLKGVAKVFKGVVRKSDMPARYGGEEFVIVLPGTSKNVALHIAEKIRAKIQVDKFPNEGAQPLGDVTASFGVATYPEDGLTAKAVLQKADHALYVAKKKGRNCVVGAGMKGKALQNPV